MVELEQERNLVRVLPRHRAQHAERGRDAVAAAFDRQLHDVLGIEIRRVLRERRAGRMLDALIDRQDRDVAGAAEPPVADERLQAAEHARRADPTCRRRARRSRARAGAAAPSGIVLHSCCSRSAASAPRISSTFDMSGPFAMVFMCRERPGILTPASETGSLPPRSPRPRRRPSSSIGSACSAASTIGSRARVAGCLGVNSVQQS